MSEIKYLVYSREHNLWWRSEAKGYTSQIDDAGRYTEEEADRHCSCRSLKNPSDGPDEFKIVSPESINQLKQELEDAIKCLKETGAYYDEANQRVKEAWAEISQLKQDLEESERENKHLQELLNGRE